MVPFAEIADPKNDINLNLPRYIDSAEPEDLQDINGHLNGGIPERDIDALADYWQLLPGVRTTLFEPLRPGYARLRLPLPEVKPATASLTELEEEHGGEEGCLGALEKIAKVEVNERLKEIKGDREEFAILKSWLVLAGRESLLKRAVKELEASLDTLTYQHYPKLTEAEIKRLVVDDKWMASLSTVVQGELDRVSQTLTGRIRQLAERYDTPLQQLVDEVDALAAKVDGHLRTMGVQ